MWGPIILAGAAALLALATQYERTRQKKSADKPKTYEDGLKDGEARTEDRVRSERARQRAIEKTVRKQVAWQSALGRRGRPSRLDDDDLDDVEPPPAKSETKEGVKP